MVFRGHQAQGDEQTADHEKSGRDLSDWEDDGEPQEEKDSAEDESDEKTAAEITQLEREVVLHFSIWWNS